MIYEIGETAGNIWQVLNDNGESTFAKVKKKVGGSDDILHQAIGWLAREDKLTISKKGSSVKLSVK